jgi:hypothetical protein
MHVYAEPDRGIKSLSEGSKSPRLGTRNYAQNFLKQKVAGAGYETR